MLALTAAAHGQDPTQILVILAAIAAALFWRVLLKVALALVVILFAILLVRVFHGESVLFQDLRLMLG
ncbi:MAG TPA: hypothetical protein VKV38_05160 [Trebonia sp.]|jgi:hypothetical protein|nr:hypothetical protein [Trebonia sp.]